MREKYPVTLTADAALLLAKMKDADLAPLEAAAEDAGVDPAHYYTTHTLCDAFLAKCDQARMQSFAPLFEGSADAARAALAALLPNTFLQALVWRTLTTPEAELLPEVTGLITEQAVVLDMAKISANTLGQFDDRYTIFSLPYLFKGQERPKLFTVATFSLEEVRVTVA